MSSRGLGQAELRELGERLLDLGSRPQLESPVLLGHGALRGARPTRRSSEPACPPRGAAPAPEPASRSFVTSRSPAVAVLATGPPGLERLVGRPQAAAQQPALEPVDLRRRGDARGAQVGEQVRGAAAADRGPKQRDQARAGGGARGRQIGLHRDRDVEARRAPGGRAARPSAGRGARSRSPRRDAVVEQPGDLGADGLDLGELPGGGEQRDAAVVLDRLAGLQLAEAALELEQGRALREARARTPGARSSRPRSPEARRRAPRVPRSATRGPPRAGRRSPPALAESSRTSSSCSTRQVVEAVEEDRARSPGVGPLRGARRSRRRRGSGRRGGRARRGPAR